MTLDEVAKYELQGMLIKKWYNILFYNMVGKNLRLYDERDILRMNRKLFGLYFTPEEKIIGRLNVIHLENISLGHYDI